MAEQVSTSAASRKPSQTIGEVTIEIAGPINENVLFPPLQERMRGRWEKRKLPLGDTGEIYKLPDIPGLYIRVDPRSKTLQMIDPLGLPENADLMKEIARKYKEIAGLGSDLSGDKRPREGVRKVVKNDDEVATWLYWMWRLVSEGMAVKISGPDLTLTLLQEAYPEAKVRRNWYDSTAYGRGVMEPLAEVES